MVMERVSTSSTDFRPLSRSTRRAIFHTISYTVFARRFEQSPLIFDHALWVIDSLRSIADFVPIESSHSILSAGETCEDRRAGDSP